MLTIPSTLLHPKTTNLIHFLLKAQDDDHMERKFDRKCSINIPYKILPLVFFVLCDSVLRNGELYL
jgi:hypothetical protein